MKHFLSFVLLAGLAITTTQAQSSDLSPQAGPYDNGKMWTFEYPPTDYLSETYDFQPDEAWFERARLSALRIPGCSASFVSPTGLVVTNHHCVRGRLPSVAQPGEQILDNGFYASSLEEERRIPGYYADQLIGIEDVTDEVYAALEGQETDAERAAAREEAFAVITARIKEDQGTDNTQVQVISLYNGGRYSAYIFHRYTDVRLVMAVELQLGFFGGEPDNFTYPRYALDFAFLRIYDADGSPMASPHHFSWNEKGIEEGDLVFVIGNPGSTTRHATVSQLEYLRDVGVAHTLRFLNNRLAAYRDFYAAYPEEGEAMNVRNRIFSISNSQKAYAGRQAALNDPVILARRADAERLFKAAIDEDAALQAEYAGLFDQMTEIQQEKKMMGDMFGAFLAMTNPTFSSSTLPRAVHTYRYLTMEAQGLTGDNLDRAKQQALGVSDKPMDLEHRLLEARMTEIQVHLGDDDPITQQALNGKTPAEATADMLAQSVLASAEKTASALEAGTLTMDDPALQLVGTLLQRLQDHQSASAGLNAREGEVAGALGRARFAVYGTDVPPDATFSPRITDGVVKGYAYNGTEAPPYTTFFGMYDHYYSYGGDIEWNLPERWQTPARGLNLSTPLNFISTSDTIGGNSGSPVVTRNLELVGLNFDRNIEGLSRDYIYLPERGRNIAVDMRAVREALDVMYDADRIVLELTTGRMVPTEAEADQQ